MLSALTGPLRATRPAASSAARAQTRGIIHQAEPGLYWLDVVAYDVDLRERFNRVRIVLLTIVIGLAIALGFSVGLSK